MTRYFIYALVGAVGIDHPREAAKMVEWSPAAQLAAVGHLAMMVDQRASMTSVELWRVRKGERELRCVAVYLPTGIDVRLLERDGFRTQLVKDAPGVEELAGKWREALIQREWTAEP